VPEPSALVLCAGSAAAALALRRWRRGYRGISKCLLSIVTVGLLLASGPASGQPISFAGSTSLTPATSAVETNASGSVIYTGTGSLVGATGTAIDTPSGYTLTTIDRTYTSNAADIGHHLRLKWGLNRYAYESVAGPVFPVATTSLDGFVTFSTNMHLDGIHQEVNWVHQLNLLTPELFIDVDTSAFFAAGNRYAFGSAAAPVTKSTAAVAATSTASGPYLTDLYLYFTPTAANETIHFELPTSSSSSLTVPVPEPASWALTAGSATGALAACVAGRRRS